MSEQKLQQPILIQENQFFDHRGKFIGTPIHSAWVENNVSTNQRGTFRGMHFQIEDTAQAKLVRVLSGSVVDVIVDLRNLPNNKNYLNVGVYNLISFTKAHNNLALYIPKGFAHGFLTLEDNTIFEYKVDAPYAPGKGRGINWKSFPIFEEIFKKFNIGADQLIISEKDKDAQTLNDWLKLNEKAIT